MSQNQSPAQAGGAGKILSRFPHVQEESIWRKTWRRIKDKVDLKVSLKDLVDTAKTIVTIASACSVIGASDNSVGPTPVSLPVLDPTASFSSVVRATPALTMPSWVAPAALSPRFLTATPAPALY